jgi:hypothetical protein
MRQVAAQTLSQVVFSLKNKEELITAGGLDISILSVVCPDLGFPLNKRLWKLPIFTSMKTLSWYFGWLINREQILLSFTSGLLRISVITRTQSPVYLIFCSTVLLDVSVACVRVLVDSPI